MTFECWIPGAPVAWSRTGQHSLPDGRVIKFDQKKQRVWKSTFVVCAQRQLAEYGYPMPLYPHPMPVRLVIVIGAALPISEHRKRGPVAEDWNVSSKDWDNLGKLVSDAANNILWTDDRQVVSAHVEKVRMAQGEPAGVLVVAEPASDLRLDEASVYLQRARQVAGLIPMQRRTG